MRNSLGITFSVGVRLVLAVAGVGSAGAQQAPAPHPLAAPVLTSAPGWRGVSQVIALADGRVFVHDTAARQVVLLDATLSNPRIVLDSVMGHDNSYGPRPGLLLRFRGDSVLFATPGVGSSILVIGPDGAIHRQLAGPTAPSPSYSIELVSFSPALGLVYKLRMPSTTLLPVEIFPPLGPGQIDTLLTRPDFVRLIAMDLDTHHADTLARLMSGNQVSRRLSQAQLAYGGATSAALYGFIDDVVVGNDGALAVLHALEYRVGWISADRIAAPSPRIPYSWQQISDAERTRLLDSINGARQARYAPTLAKWIADSASGQPQRRGAQPPAALANLAARGRGTPGLLPRPRPPMLAQPSEIPDFLPPVGKHAMLADMDGHVWILPIVRATAGATGPPGPATGATWDVVDRQGALVQRVTIPINARLVGFAPVRAILVAGSVGAQALQEVPIR
jgi:hypothetical protein